MDSFADSRSSAEAAKRACAPSTSRRTRPHKSSSQLASAETLKRLKVVLLPATALFGDVFALVRCRVADGVVESCGKKSARALLTATRASSKLAIATAICWFL